MVALRERIAKAVDFPGFVAALVQGVFDAVDASIQQMKSYAELLAKTARCRNCDSAVMRAAQGARSAPSTMAPCGWFDSC